MAKKIGAIVLATDQGLGYLAKAFFDHGLINKVFIKTHSTRKNHLDWYPAAAQARSVDELLDCDAIMFFENAFDWKIIPRARARGVVTALMPMYECTPSPLPYEPDLILCPSDLDFDFYKDKPNAHRINVPVEVKGRLRTHAKIFVHNAGNGGLGGRNGTKEVIEAMKLVKSPIKLILRTQEPIAWNGDTRITIHHGTFPKEQLFDYGDVFIFPEKFNGLSLPLQEAYAAGMLVMAGNRYPINNWLPKEPLIPVERYTKERITARQFDCAHYSPAAIAVQIDKWYNSDITKFSQSGLDWAKQNSWSKLKEIYEKLMFA